MLKVLNNDLSYLECLKGEENMKRDWENLQKVEESGGEILRFYSWSERTLSIGYSQEAPRIAIKVVKRPTGGGALLHGWDLSFSYAGPRDKWGNSFTKIYINFMGLILEILRDMDKAFEMSRYKGGYDDFFCYFYPTLGEISIGGKKVIACAMRVMKNSFLIHGSLFWDMDYSYFEKLTGIRADILRQRIITLRELGLEEKDLFGILKALRNTLK